MDDIKRGFKTLIANKPASTEVDLEDYSEPDYTRTPPKAHSAMFPGILGEIVEAVCSETEAVPVAVGANIIARFSAMIGRPSKQLPDAPSFSIGDSEMHCRPFYLITGETGKGRKGTSDKPARIIFQRVDQLLFERHSLINSAENKSELEQYWPLNTHGGGLSTGEGLAYFLRDDQEGKGGEIIPGQPDKRLFVVEEEFANALAVCKREHNTISGTLRKLWDGETLSPLTKSDRTIASNPHVSIVGHITAYEFIEKSTGNDIANGLLNRFVVLYSKREKLVALPQRTADYVINDLATVLADAVEFGQAAGGLTLEQSAKEYWEPEYNRLTCCEGGRAISSLFARSEPYALMHAAIFALLDKRKFINVADLKAALHWVEYWRHSLVYIFDGERKQVEAEVESSFADEVYQAVCKINNGKGCTRTEISHHFCRNTSAAEYTAALEKLMASVPPKVNLKRVKLPGKRNRVKTYHPIRN